MKTPTRRGPNPETAIVRGILAALRGRHGKFWRNNSGRVRGASGRTVQLGETGSADIFGVVRPSGRFVGLEVKRPGLKATDLQESWAAEIRAEGGYVATVTSVEEAFAAVDRARGVRVEVAA
jgi:hypothetical protein